MSLCLYDGSFDGLLTAIFDCFADRVVPVDIVNQAAYQASLLDDIHPVQTDIAKAERVIKGLDARSDGKAGKLVYHLYLSELPGMEMHLFRLAQLLVRQNNPAILENFATPDVLRSAQVNKMISREVHRMHAFVRFQKATNGIYYAVISPDFNVMPLIGDHFYRRYADQSWVIFDTARDYGLYYDLQEVTFIDANSPVLSDAVGGLQSSLDGIEDHYQQLWHRYFHSVNIQARRNIKLHLRHMPKRYWKYLTEKSM